MRFNRDFSREVKQFLRAMAIFHGDDGVILSQATSASGWMSREE